MLGMQYQVKRGDSLWSIAGKHLGDPNRWPEVHQHNNSAQVTAITGVKIPNPDLIFVGQTLYLPGINRPATPQVVRSVPQHPRAGTGAQSGGREQARAQVRSMPLKYDLADLPAITVASPAHIATLKLNGSITLQSRNSVEFLSLSRSSAQLAMKQDADHALGRLVTNTQIGFNPRTNEITFEMGLTAHAPSIQGALSTGASVGISSETGLPVIKGTVNQPEIRGSVSNHLYVTSDFSVEIEITMRPPTATNKPAPVPSATPLPVAPPQQRSGWDNAWDYLKGGALIVGAGVLIVATLGENLFTGPVGVANDPASFAAAAAMFTGGVALIHNVRGGTPIPIEGYELEKEL